MICEVCKKNNATTHIKTVVNGKITEKHLCHSCALKQGVNDGFGFDAVSSMLTSIFGDTEPMSNAVSSKRCACCGSSFNDIVSTGKLGCSVCYETFFDELLPYLKRVHGSVKHIGKEITPESAVQSEKTETADELQNKLKKLIEEEKYEQAAVIRDKIKQLREGEK